MNGEKVPVMTNFAVGCRVRYRVDMYRGQHNSIVIPIGTVGTIVRTENQDSQYKHYPYDVIVVECDFNGSKVELSNARPDITLELI